VEGVHRESGRYEGDGEDYSTDKVRGRSSSSSKPKDEAPKKEQSSAADDKKS